MQNAPKWAFSLKCRTTFIQPSNVSSEAENVFFSTLRKEKNIFMNSNFKSVVKIWINLKWTPFLDWKNSITNEDSCILRKSSERIFLRNERKIFRLPRLFHAWLPALTRLTSSTTSLLNLLPLNSASSKKTFFISTISGETISRSINRHRIHSFIQLLHNTRLVLVGIESNNVIFSFIHSITTHKHNHHGSHISAKDLLPTQAGKKRFRSVIHCYHQAPPSRACFFPPLSGELVFHVLLNSPWVPSRPCR